MDRVSLVRSERGELVAIAKGVVDHESSSTVSPPPAALTQPARRRGRREMPVIEWSEAGLAALAPQRVAPPAEWRDNSPLPRSDVVVITWTPDEWNALDHVFFGPDEPPWADDAAPAVGADGDPADDSSGDSEDDSGADATNSGRRPEVWQRAWRYYRRDFYRVKQGLWLQREIAQRDRSAATQPRAPALRPQAWGSFHLATVGTKTVLLFKSSLHINTDGEALPLRQLLCQLIEDSHPQVLLSTGTAGGVRAEDGLGDVLVTNAARFRLGDEFKSASFNHRSFRSTWTPPPALVEQANRLLRPVDELPLEPPTTHYPQLSPTIPRVHTPAIKIVGAPILTTDFFEFGTTTNGLSADGCCVEMDDALVAMEAEATGTAYGFIRNVSDPVLNGTLAARLQGAWAAETYKRRGLYTSFNSAVATWAMIAG